MVRALISFSINERKSKTCVQQNINTICFFLSINNISRKKQTFLKATTTKAEPVSILRIIALIIFHIFLNEIIK